MIEMATPRWLTAAARQRHSFPDFFSANFHDLDCASMPSCGHLANFSLLNTFRLILESTSKRSFYREYGALLKPFGRRWETSLMKSFSRNLDASLKKYPLEAVDIHHIVVRKTGAKDLFVYILAILVLAYAFYHYVIEEKSVTILYYSLLLDIVLVKLLLWKPIAKESVVIMPAFGVQLETHYRSGKVIRCFVPIDKILKPVLLECVTPVTCYWTLSLIVRGESELVLIFKNLRPPVKMLVHLWKALCAATGSNERLDISGRPSASKLDD